MGTINVAFNGKPLFEWQGTTEEFDHMEAPITEAASRAHSTASERSGPR
jgi:hypothetical protein